MTEFLKTDQNRIRRMPERGHYDRATIHAIVDEALICHVGFVVAGEPVVIPTIHARLDDELVLHGAKASRLLKHILAGHPICVTITLLDGLVVARSAFNSSMNYRSVVIFGHGRLIETDAEKMAAVAALTEHLLPGRWQEVRPTTQKELDATTVVAINMESASAKIRTGPPHDDEEDLALPIWAGVLPLQLTAQPPIAAPDLPKNISIPEYLTHYDR